MTLEKTKGVNDTDGDIKETFRFLYKIKMSDAELIKFSNFLTAHYAEYPNWSERELVEDNTELNAADAPIRIAVLKKPERYYESYLDFKKTKP